MSVNYDVANGAMQKANGFCKRVRSKRAIKLRNAVGNGDCRICFKVFNKLIFLTKTDGKKFRKNFPPQGGQLKGARSTSAKQSHFQPYCKDKIPKQSLCPQKLLKTEIFSLICRRKKSPNDRKLGM